MKAFDNLTHLGRGRRVKPLAADLLKRQFGISPIELRQVAETVNLVYRIRTANSHRFVLRLTSPQHFHDRRDVCSEITWVRDLHEQGVPVPAPISAKDGSTVVTTSWEGIPGEWHGVVFDWIRGTDLAARWTEVNVERYGKLAARLHVAGERFTPPEDFRVRPADNVFPHCHPDFAHPEPFVLFEGLPADLLTPARRKLFHQAHDLAQAEITRLFQAGTPQPIHNDLHPWNVMLNRKEIVAIDFENLLMGFPVQDIGTTLNYFRNYFNDEVPFEQRLASFRTGYEAVRPWPETFPGQIRLMTASHRLLLCNYYASHHDPEYREFAYKVFEIVEQRLQEDLEPVGSAEGD